MNFSCDTVSNMNSNAGRSSKASRIRLFLNKITCVLTAVMTLGLIPWSASQAVGNALNGAYEWKYTCQHCHGTPQPNSSAAFSDYDTTANRLSVYANDPAAITRAANEGYIVPEGNSNDKVDPGANTNDPMGTWSGMGPKRLGVGRTPTQYAMDFSAYFASLFKVPEAPTMTTATAGNGQAIVSFSVPKSDLTITAYTVTAHPGNFTGTGTASPIMVSGLSNGTAYTFTVSATSNAGAGKASAPSNSVTPSAASGAPTAVTANVVSKPSAPTPALAVAPVPAVTRPAAPIKSPSVPHSITTATGAGAPVIKFVRAGSAQVKVFFDAPAEANINGYTVTALSNGAPTGVFATGTTSPIIVKGLTNGTDYTFTVTANTSNGRHVTSLPSNTSTPLHILGD